MPEVTIAQCAVFYVLKKMRADAVLRANLLHTEAFALLCHAEADRSGLSEEEVERMYDHAGAPVATNRLDISRKVGV